MVTTTVRRGEREVRLIRACMVEVVRGPSAGQRVRIARPEWGIGSHPTNQLVLADRTVSKHHAEVQVTAHGYRVVDLSSSNGVSLGNLRVRDVTVPGPVQLTLGESTVALTPEGVDTELPSSAEEEVAGLVGRAAVMRELFHQLTALAPTECSVLIEGESGVGKELVAEALHRLSARQAGPLVVIDCGAIVSGLLESELFGHVRGAFTGAQADHVGLLEQANGGTVFFDQIEALALPLQVKLLGALERREIRPVGARRERKLDVRLVAATQEELGRAVNEGRFRADLFYRLAVARLRVPPLRERLEDIPLLTRRFLAELRERAGAEVPAELSAVAMARLGGQLWPGNVRELRGAVERAALGLAASPAIPSEAPIGPLFAARAAVLERFEREYFTQLMQTAGGNLNQMCRLTQLDRRYLARILKRLGLRALP
jgi:DNA-binding NtrC family response regulator